MWDITYVMQHLLYLPHRLTVVASLLWMVWVVLDGILQTHLLKDMRIKSHTIRQDNLNKISGKESKKKMKLTCNQKKNALRVGVRNHQSSKNFEKFVEIQIILEKHKEKKFERGLNEIRNFSTIGHFKTQGLMIGGMSTKG